MNKYFALLLLFFTTLLSAETVYKSVDKNGNIIFTDQPVEGAEKIEIREAQSVEIPEARSIKLSPPDSVIEKKEYNDISIISPLHDSTIHDNNGSVSIDAELSPDLFTGDKIVFYLDGMQVAEGESLQHVLNNIDRGSHTINVAVVNSENREIKRSDDVVFHLRRASKLFNQKPPVEKKPQTPPPPIP